MVGSGIPRRRRWAGRLGAVGAAVAIGLGGLPGTASAAPSSLSDGRLGAATKAAEEAAAQVGQLLDQVGAAQAGVDDASARVARALEQVEAQRRAHETAQADARTADVAAQEAGVALSDAQGAVATFARDSYMAGSTSPVLEILLTAGSPGQLVERAALLEAAGSHRSAVLTVVTAAQQRAAEAQAAAQNAVTEADRSQQAAQDALASAEAVRAAAARQVADLQTAQDAMQAQLLQARTTLVTLQQQQQPSAAAPSSPPATIPGGEPSSAGSGGGARPAMTGTRSPAASPVATGASTRATVSMVACSSPRRPGSPSAALPMSRAPTWPRALSRSPSRRSVLAVQGPGAWPTCGRNLVGRQPEPLLRRPVAGCDRRPATRFAHGNGRRAGEWHVGRSVLVTGGNRGIGLAIARVLRRGGRRGRRDPPRQRRPRRALRRPVRRHRLRRRRPRVHRGRGAPGPGRGAGQQRRASPATGC